ncbi:MAG: hypothetical protein SFT94_05920 [Pseudanabaenaceae cyanobacterium bins.68]|nr:hypothetical protein [Pseudanabaenaceae cyanobacterium bins.68]
MMPKYRLEYQLGYCLGILALSLPITFAPGFLTPDLESNAQNIPVYPANSGAQQYLVYLNDLSLLSQVKLAVPDAFVGRLDSGTRVIQLGRYNNQASAQRQVEQLRTSGLAPQIAPVASRLAANIPITFDNSGFTTTEIPSPGDPTPPLSTPEVGVDLVPLPGVPATPRTNEFRQSDIEIKRAPGANANNFNPPANQPLPPGVGDNVATAPAPARNRYFVIVPSSLDTVLQKARGIVPSARMAVSERGTYVELQAFPDRGSADNLTRNVRSQGLDARVVYF